MRGVIKNCRGSHIDVVISFVIFVIFLGFLYSIISPIKIKEDKETTLNYLEKEMIEKMSANLTSSSTKVDAFHDCFEIHNIVNNSALNIIVLDINNTPVRFAINDVGQDRYIRIDGHTSKRNFKVYYSSENFSKLSLNESCTFEIGTYNAEFGENDPIKTVGLVRVEKYVFETKVRKILEDATVYNEIKDDFNLPYGTNFDFRFKFADGNVVGRENKDIKGNVYVREVFVPYMNKTAGINYGTLYVRVW